MPVTMSPSYFAVVIYHPDYPHGDTPPGSPERKDVWKVRKCYTTLLRTRFSSEAAATEAMKSEVKTHHLKYASVRECMSVGL